MKILEAIAIWIALVKIGNAEERYPTFDEWRYSIVDYPTQALDKIKDLQESASKLTFQDQLRLRVVNCMAGLQNSLDICQVDQLNQLAIETTQQNMPVETYFVMEAKARMFLRQARWSECQAALDELLIFVQKNHVERFRLRTYLLYGNLLVELRKITEGLEYFAKAKHELDQRTDHDPLDRHIALMEFTMSSPDQTIGRRQSKEIFVDALRFFQEKHLRSMQASAEYNLGVLLLDDDISSLLKVRSHFQNAADNALAVDDYYDYGAAILGLVELDVREKQYASATHRIHEVIPALKKVNKDWLLIAYTELANVHMLQGQDEAALGALLQAESYMGQDRDPNAKLFRLKFVLLEKRGLYEQAYKLLRELHDGQIKRFEEQSKMEYNKLKVNLGLSIEEEKARLLKVENGREKQTSFYKSIVLFLLIVLVLALKHQRDRVRRLQEHIRKTVLQRFFPPPVVQKVMAGGSPFDQPAQESLITVVFCDLVDFTHSSEKLGPQKTAEMLNAFFRETTDVIFAAGGTIDKFIGDAVMILFGVPMDEEAHIQAEKAFTCSLAILNSVKRLNETWQKELGIQFAIRIGMHQGQAIIGSFGGQKRSDYTAIGSTVNIAARIEARAAPNTITMSDTVALLLPQVPLSALGSVTLRGVSQPVVLLEYRDEILKQAV